MPAVGGRSAGEGGGSKVRGLGESLLAENQEKAFSWGTEPLLGVVCHPCPAAGDMGAESSPGEAQ